MAVSHLFTFQLDLICDKTDQATDISPWTVTHATSSRDADESAHAAISLGDGEAIEAAGDEYGIGEWGDAGGQTFEASDLFTFQLDLTTETIRPTESLFDL